MYVDADFVRAETLVLDGAPVELLVTRTMPLDEAEEAFAVADGGAEIKVQFSFPVGG
jgi:threonine dehydrogenase-like Zn-dependent dehydrogenase